MIRSSADTVASHDVIYQLRFLAEALRSVTWLSNVSADEMNTRDRWWADRLDAIADQIPPAWQPIATAPKDGTTVLIAVNVPPFGWITGYAQWHNIERIGGAWVARGFGLFGELGLSAPTHWMPLPAPPQIGSATQATDAEPADATHRSGSAKKEGD